MSKLTGKVALVTGGSKGIGRATTEALAAAGANVAINYASDADSANLLVENLGSDRACSIRADAGSIRGAEEMINATLSRFGRLDILVLCAGTSPMFGLSDTTEEAFDKAIQLNVKGPYFVAQKAAAVMSEGSRIVLISSSLVHFSSAAPKELLYCMCKGAIEQMTRIVSKDLAERQITVNAVAPGPVDGEFQARQERRSSSQDHI